MMLENSKNCNIKSVPNVINCIGMHKILNLLTYVLLIYLGLEN